MDAVNKFYINYEECKYINAISIKIIYPGFILTMRNVNCSEINLSALPTSGFILTMRNVN